MSVTISHDGIVTAVAPYAVKEESIHNFVKRHVDWIKKNLLKIEKRVSNDRVINKDLAIFSKAHYKRHKERARKIITARVAELNSKPELKFRYRKISIRNQRGRWGSCSSSGNLNFNYKLIFHKPEVMDYVIIHELCHLKEMNHSKRYWALVERACPDYKKLEKELKGVL